MPIAAPKFTIVAGPNGAGKTTLVENVFPQLKEDHHFINADYLAHEISPDNVEKVAISAGKSFLKTIDSFLENQESFVIETTLAGNSLLKKVEKAKQKNFSTRLIFLWIRTFELCDFRVKGRVAHGGHNIPIEDIQRRYVRGLNNFPKYLEAVDDCEVYLADKSPVLIYEKNSPEQTRVADESLYKDFLSSIGTI